MCSAYRGNIEENVKFAKNISRTISLEGNIPITPHIYFTQFLEDDNKNERELGIKFGIELMKLCDEMNVYGNITEGMKKEIEIWEKIKNKKPNYYELIRS